MHIPVRKSFPSAWHSQVSGTLVLPRLSLSSGDRQKISNPCNPGPFAPLRRIHGSKLQELVAWMLNDFCRLHHWRPQCTSYLNYRLVLRKVSAAYSGKARIWYRSCPRVLPSSPYKSVSKKSVPAMQALDFDLIQTLFKNYKGSATSSTVSVHSLSRVLQNEDLKPCPHIGTRSIRFCVHGGHESSERSILLRRLSTDSCITKLCGPSKPGRRLRCLGLREFSLRAVNVSLRSCLLHHTADHSRQRLRHQIL